MIDGFPDGYGKAVSYQNGQFYAAYEGLWKKGFPNPFGGLITSPSSVYNGSYYFGMWENGSFLGSKGEYKYPSGSTFKGMYVQNSVFGYQMYIYVYHIVKKNYIAGIFDFNGPVYGSIDFKNNQTYTGK